MLVRLTPLTDDARQAVNDAEVVVERLPFKIGRENRRGGGAPRPKVERRRRQAPQLNDLYLVDPLMYVSHAHFQIESRESRFFVVDRGSAGGTLVAGQRIGGDRTGGRAEIKDGDVLVVGAEGSPFAFRFRADG